MLREENRMRFKHESLGVFQIPVHHLLFQDTLSGPEETAYLMSTPDGLTLLELAWEPQLW